MTRPAASNREAKGNGAEHFRHSWSHKTTTGKNGTVGEKLTHGTGAEKTKECVPCGNVERWDEIKVCRELDVNTAKRTKVTMKKAQYTTSAGSNDICE